ALPALRETQPGIPAIGCAADVLGFYWNMAIIAISSIMILMSSALRWKEPSVDHEINLIHRQHNLQTKLISEMAIPMPLPMTGGPHYEYQYQKKRIPFITSRESRNYLGRYQTSLEDEDDYDNVKPFEDRTKESPYRGDQSGAQEVYGMEHLDGEDQYQLGVTSQPKPRALKDWIYKGTRDNDTPPSETHSSPYPPMYSTRGSSSEGAPGNGTGAGSGQWPSGAQEPVSSPQRPNAHPIDVASSPLSSTTQHPLSRR
ncbi:hypothetical protein CPB97_002633, partial [Podila verticillata]